MAGLPPILYPVSFIIREPMVLKSGSKIGPYVIQSPLGAGGMGEVYRARDSRLDRDVALKVLLTEIAGDADRRARFEREAKTVAALSHPNIVALYEVGNADGIEYTVSELVDGELLREKMQQGAMPVKQVVELATQFADGMAAAHAAGIVHRDLKPENVMVTRDGRVKILDFGLARIIRATPISGSGSGNSADTIANAATIASPANAEYMTSPGMVLGTVAYMSPEQARGQDAGYRSDQFSFGLILYEMLGGKQAFARGSAVETMAAIVRDEPEPLEGKIPVPLKWLVDRCLEKDPTRRYDSTRDLYQQLRTMRDHFSEAYTSGVQALLPEVAQAGAKRRVFSLRTVIAMAALAAVLAGAFAWWLHPAGVELSKYKYTPFAVNAGSPLWSPDGKMAAYAGMVSDDRELFLRRLDSPTPQQLTSAPGFARPLGWSLDSSHIFYLQITPGVLTGTIFSIASVGGEPEALWTLPAKNEGIVAISPDGKAGALYCLNIIDPCDMEVSDPIGSPPRVYPDSHVKANNIFGVPQMKFSPDGKKLLLIRAGDSGLDESWLLPWPAGKGTPRQILKKLPHDAGTPTFSWLPDSRHLIVATNTGIEGTRHLYLADTKSDSLQQITQGTTSEDNPSVSPDGASILYAENHIDYDILSMSLKDGTTQGMIVTPRSESMPAWAAKGDSLVYVSNRLGPEDIWLHTKDGVDRPLVTRASFASDPPKWMFAPVLSPDGTRVIFVAVGKSGATWLWEVSVAGGDPVRLVDASDSSSQQFTGDWSPDGKQFVFMGLEPDGTSSLKVVKTSGGATAQKIAAHNTSVPSWSPDGKWIAYLDDNLKYHLVSPDGKQHRDLGLILCFNMGFSKDSKTAYGIRQDGASSIFSRSISRLRSCTTSSNWTAVCNRGRLCNRRFGLRWRRTARVLRIPSPSRRAAFGCCRGLTASKRTS